MIYQPGFDGNDISSFFLHEKRRYFWTLGSIYVSLDSTIKSQLEPRVNSGLKQLWRLPRYVQSGKIKEASSIPVWSKLTDHQHDFAPFRWVNKQMGSFWSAKLASSVTCQKESWENCTSSGMQSGWWIFSGNPRPKMAETFRLRIYFINCPDSIWWWWLMEILFNK